ncbi:hypothetical protein GCM10027180_29860 [Microbulbifer echini]
MIRIFCHIGTGRIKMEAVHADSEGYFIKKSQGFETAFPESTRTIVFGIGLTGDRFV